MKLALAIAVALAACTGPKAKPESPIVNEGSAVAEHCCCKAFPLSSEDGKPVYSQINRMECSVKQGECVSDIQCETTAE